MPDLTLDTFLILTGLLLLTGSLTGSAFSFLSRSGNRRAAHSEGARFANGGYDRPAGWPEPAWATDGVPQRSYSGASAARPRRRLLRSVLAAALAFGGTTAGLYAYNGTLPLTGLPAIPIFEALAPAPAPVPADPQPSVPPAPVVAEADGPPPYGQSERLSETRLVWPAAIRSR